LLEFGRYLAAAAVVTDGEHQGHRVGEAAQIHAGGLCLKSETVVAARLDLNLQAHAVDHAFEDECSSRILVERAGRNGDGKGSDLQRDVFAERISTPGYTARYLTRA